MVTVRKDLLLNECGDEKIENGDSVLVDGVDQIRQSWLIHMRTIKGEVISNLNIGMPWFGENGILNKHSDMGIVEQYFIEESLKVPGIIRVNGVSIDVNDATRRSWTITVRCVAEGEEGEQIFNYQGSLPLGYCTNTSDDNYPLQIDNLAIWFDAQDLSNLTYAPPSLRLENKAGTGYAIGMSNGSQSIADGDMEESGTSSWNNLYSTLSKQTGSPHSGLQSLRVVTTNANGRARQLNVITSGKTYKFTGYARSQDGINSPSVYAGIDVIWTGTASTSWQEFDIIYETDSEHVGYGCIANGATVEFDDCYVRIGTDDYPMLNGVSGINNKRAVYFNNTSTNGNAQHLAFYDTPAIRGGDNELTAFFVGRSIDTGYGGHKALIALRGQNDAGNSEECIYWLRGDQEVDPEPQAKLYSDTDLVTYNYSRGTSGVSGLYNPFYDVAILKNGSTSDFYFNGVSATGNTTISTRKLDGDGYIGASIGSDCATTNYYSYLYFGEVLVYSRVLTSSEIDLVNAWLAAKWGF